MKNWIVLGLAGCVMALCTLAADTTPRDPAPASYQIRNRKFNELLRPENANNANGTHIVLYPAQPWKCMTWKLIPAAGTAFYLQNHFTNKTFESKTNAEGSTVVQVPLAPESSGRPCWIFARMSDGLYRISDQRSGECLTAVSKDVIRLAPWKETPEQQWELVLTDPAKLTM